MSSIVVLREANAKDIEFVASARQKNEELHNLVGAASGPSPVLADPVLPSATAAPLPAQNDIPEESGSESPLDTDEENEDQNQKAAAAAAEAEAAATSAAVPVPVAASEAGSQCKNCGASLAVGLTPDECPDCSELMQIFAIATDCAPVVELPSRMPASMPMDVDSSGGVCVDVGLTEEKSSVPEVGLLDVVDMDVDSTTFEVIYG
jgi:hypothetical protein